MESTTKIIIKKNMSWKEKLSLSSHISSGKFIHNKTKKIVEVIGRNSYLTLLVKHANGRITEKGDHYFVGEYSSYEEKGSKKYKYTGNKNYRLSVDGSEMEHAFVKIMNDYMEQNWKFKNK